ncbi:MAG: hypothetical protein GTO45_30140 [Candidatus Aminicenantes bacterium]|nr:hypothetical protein [Candidatus Aminicenantes bacterium]NIM83053.1 hypothetical protein [Candidatus Aminicenantes bacterium]NIN22432.1 hypothetical protein [Candidatus Aminicenantes bacterium]NIN46200.1 hypothetical protein [Candidatus Aminicenantes bacterium]NIN89037.1 hypothetical protein [Candidatus Aminicenantes bacterium]
MKKNFSFFTLSERELDTLKAGEVTTCGCGCAWADCGGSSNVDNSLANSDEETNSEDWAPRDSEGNYML